jgi:hypothetical protein
VIRPTSTAHFNIILQVLQRQVESTQYVSIRYTNRLAEAGIEPPVGSVGDFNDNALPETINGLFEAELIHATTPSLRPRP